MNPVRLLIIFFLVFAGLLSAEIQTGLCVGVSDGDTITMLTRSKEQIKVRLHGIDAPESRQDFGLQAREKLSSLLYGKQLTVYIASIDRFGRSVGKVYTGNLNANEEMVRCGLAWHYVRYAPNDDILSAAEKEARERRLGLWAQPQPTPPVQWRRKKNISETVAKSAPAGSCSYWISGNGRIHNLSCRYYGSSSNGEYTNFPRGVNCKVCGGAGEARK